MQIDNPARQREFEAPIGSRTLAEGLMMVRVSTLKMIRLQLAMERRDRRVALEEVDELLALDRRLQEYLAAVPALDEQLLFRRVIDSERAMLNHEKLTLAAEVLRREPEPVGETADTQEDDWLGPRDLPIEDEPRRRRSWLAVVPALALALAGAAYFLGRPEAHAWLAGAVRALQ